MEPKTGRLEEPVFVRGDPTKAPRWQPKRTTPWARHIELGRDNPARWDMARQEYDGGWMLVSKITKGGCRARKEAIERDRSAIMRWLDRHHPLERWQLRVVTVAGTHCDRELYLRYLTTLTPEEDATDRKIRHESYLAQQVKRIENRERRAAEARRKAAEEEAAAQVRVRGSRRTRG